MGQRSPVRSDVVSRIVRIRQDLQLSQVAFARRLGISRTTLRRFEAGHVPGLAILERIAEAGGLTVARLLAPPLRASKAADRRSPDTDPDWWLAIEALRAIWPDPKRWKGTLTVLRALETRDRQA